MGKLALLNLVGGIALLFWGLHMVQSGILRAFGADLRHSLAISLRNRFTSFAAGLVITMLLQSSTATALMTTTFVSNGLFALVPALAIMLGANVGSTLVVQLFSFDATLLAPFLLAGGVIAFKCGPRTWTRDVGRVCIGLGLMLLSLHMLLDTLTPAENVPKLRLLLATVTAAPIIDILIGAVLAWAAHSSVAVVLLVISLGYSSFITPVAAFALVLGANLGSAVNPLIEGGGLKSPVHRRLPLGNFINRLVGCALALPFLTPITEALTNLDPNPIRLIANFHTLFNCALAVLFIGPLPAFARLLEWLLPEPVASPDPAQPIYLDSTVLDSPSVALTCAARETMRMGDFVEKMLRETIDALMTDDRKLVASIERMDNVVDKLHEAIKLYVITITRHSLDEREGRRAFEIIAFAINLEHIGDIIDKNLMELATKKIKNRLKFSDEGAADLQKFHRRVLDHLKLALGVFISGDVKIARQLIEEKVAIREAEQLAAEHHLARLRDGLPASIETSSLHLDILRDLKRIHSHICAAAYPALEAAGELQPTRLRAAENIQAPVGEAAGGASDLNDGAQRLSV